LRLKRSEVELKYLQVKTCSKNSNSYQGIGKKAIGLIFVGLGHIENISGCFVGAPSWFKRNA